jgi:hypothetical protein
MIYSKPTHETISKLNLNFNQKELSYSPKISQKKISQNNISQIPANVNHFSHRSNNLTYDINNINDQNNNLSLFDQDNILQKGHNSVIIPQKLSFDSNRNKNRNIEENMNDFNEIHENNTLNRNVTGFYMNEIKNIYQYEKNELILKINQLSKELVDTKTNLGEHIDYLNNYIIQLQNKHKDQIAELTLKNSDYLKSHSLNQDTRIKELESELSIEKEKNEKLQKKIEEYEEIIKNNKYNIEKLSDEKIYIDNAKKTSEDRLKQKIENIENNYTNEINKIKNNYETEIKRIKNELDLSKMDYLKMTENSKENLNKMITERTKEKSYYDNVINKLKEDIANKSNENEKLLFLTKNLQQSNEDLNEKVIKMNDEINQKEKEQKEMLKSINKIQKEKNEIIRTNSKLNSVIYGRFKKREKSKSKEY